MRRMDNIYRSVDSYLQNNGYEYASIDEKKEMTVEGIKQYLSKIVTDINPTISKDKLTELDIIDIRTRYNNLERKQDVYSLYSNRIGESGFHKIWNGDTWQNILMEVYTEDNKKFHLHNTSNKGSKNGRARLTEDEVRDIRKRRKNGENLNDVYQDYKDRLTKGSFSNIWSYQNWKNIIV